MTIPTDRLAIFFSQHTNQLVKEIFENKVRPDASVLHFALSRMDTKELTNEEIIYLKQYALAIKSGLDQLVGQLQIGQQVKVIGNGSDKSKVGHIDAVEGNLQTRDRSELNFIVRFREGQDHRLASFKAHELEPIIFPKGILARGAQPQPPPYSPNNPPKI